MRTAVYRVHRQRGEEGRNGAGLGGFPVSGIDLFELCLYYFPDFDLFSVLGLVSAVGWHGALHPKRHAGRGSVSTYGRVVEMCLNIGLRPKADLAGLARDESLTSIEETFDQSQAPSTSQEPVQLFR